MQTMNNFAMTIGYIVMATVIIWALWHITSAVRRHRATRTERISERIKARVQSQPASSDSYGGAPLGI
jgi:cbb3-type cytochrome oxidase subunit 3